MSQGQLVEYETYLILAHFLVTLIILFGWIFRSTRVWSRWVVYLTVFCWVVVGTFIGAPGYCPLTDWLWRVKGALGETELPDSFITYMLFQYGYTPDPSGVSLLSWAVLLIIFALNLLISLIERFERSREEAAKSISPPPATPDS